MSLLEDARRLAAAGSYDDGGNGSYNEPACIHCLAFPEDEHKPDCPWLAMPRIVAALEAANVVATTDPEVADCCFACGNDSHKHYDDCVWKALVTAMGDAP